VNYIGTAQERNELQTRLEWARGEERLRALVGLAWYSWLSQTRQALALADEAQALLATTAANTSNERAGWEARLQLTRGGAHWLLGDYDAALSLTLAARTGFDAMGDLAGASDAYRVETLILTEAGQSQAAAEASRMNLVCSERCGDAVRAALSRAGTAFMAVVRDGAAEAPALFDELVDEARTLDDPSINAEVEAVRAALAYARNDFVAGILHYRHCLEHARHTSRPGMRSMR